MDPKTRKKHPLNTARYSLRSGCRAIGIDDEACSSHRLPQAHATVTQESPSKRARHLPVQEYNEDETEEQLRKETHKEGEEKQIKEKGHSRLIEKETETRLLKVVLDAEETHEEGEEKQIKEKVHSRFIEKEIETRLLKDVLNDFYVRRKTQPPPIPLCRLVANEAIRTVTSTEYTLVESFDIHGYVPSNSPPFLVSLYRPGSQRPWLVTDDDKLEWGPIWCEKSLAFDSELEDEWKDLKGHKFLVWDGNHRLNAWLSRIREAYSMMAYRHIRVRCQFIQLERRQEGELLLALKSVNELTRAHVERSFADEVFLFQKFGQANKSTLLEIFGQDKKRWIEYQLLLEKRHTPVWYTVPATILAQLVWKEEFSRAISKAVAAIDKNALGYETNKQKAKRQVDIIFRDRAYKMVAVANPANGQGFFQLIYSYDWNQNGALGKEKVVILAMSQLKPERKRDILRMMLTMNRKDPIAIEKFGDNPKARAYIRKEVYWQCMYEQSMKIIEELRAEGVELPNTFEEFYEKHHHLHMIHAFPELWKDMKASADHEKQPELLLSSKRFIYRWVMNLIDKKEMVHFPEQIVRWRKMGKKTSMFSSTWKNKPMKIWEVEKCPWWIDYPVGKHHRSEHQLFKECQARNDDYEHFLALNCNEKGSATMIKKPINSSPVSREGEARKHQDDKEIAKGKGQQQRDSKRGQSLYIYALQTNVIYWVTNTTLINAFLEKVPSLALSRGGKPEKTAVKLIFADLPNGLLVENVGGNACPEWNQVDTTLLNATAMFAAQYAADEGWFVTLCTVEILLQLYVIMLLLGFSLHRTYTLVIGSSYKHPDGEKVTCLQVSLFYRSGCSMPGMDREKGEKVVKSLFDSSRCIMFESGSKHRFQPTMHESKYVRGGAERSEYFFRWLLDTFTTKGDIVIDLFAGCGGLARQCHALHRHCLSIDFDREVYQLCLLPVCVDPTSMDDNIDDD